MRNYITYAISLFQVSITPFCFSLFFPLCFLCTCFFCHVFVPSIPFFLCMFYSLLLYFIVSLPLYLCFLECFKKEVYFSQQNPSVESQMVYLRKFLFLKHNWFIVPRCYWKVFIFYSLKKISSSLFYLKNAKNYIVKSSYHAWNKLWGKHYEFI